MNTTKESLIGAVSKTLVWRGLLAIAIGVVSVVWPNITVGAFVILFAVYAFIAAGMDAVRAFTSGRAGAVIGNLLLSLLSLAAGVVALVWPGPTATVLTLIVGWWALFTGLVEIAMVFTSGRRAGERAWLILSGLISIAFAVALFIRPDLGALSLATVFGLYSIFFGISSLVVAREGHELRHSTGRPAEAVS
ncbi:HdeD family acid-resistance protein [Kribbella sp. NPDC058693]|uniref:HdeD family acid-resistance protein n=1 Tax=Kribbella sp. NPDC058693 TaxID=3346602 RepID=UPI00365F9C3A